ncbi:HesA/MoeB/ThiF family protein [Flavobacterium sediminilitoris]|uniref:HesA/MoeB/ThiF family protein n=1 Tax=Flavobacterium sediminilitoris TaxID=2024526 RepID=A0ABY4HKV2_9FLAO|nr:MULTISPECIES: HesA/MoeB/ThiF family protein [Flavobacterium]UOX33495.1 HesA/MoeB/ThiF family protein [Flavobacterium sediminilitoris]
MMEHSKRYTRQMALPEIGSLGQQKLLNAKVLVIGAGGLGCPVLQMLAASGVGTLGIVDGDVVDETNLHRQLLYTTNDCGKNKVDVAANSIQKINSDVKVNVYPEFISESNIAIISKDYEILVDCTDTIVTRYLINDISIHLGKPMIYASIHKFEGQISVFNYQSGPSYRCLFPEKNAQEVPNCITTGVLGVLPNTLGMLQATEILKIILGIGKVLSGKLLIYNALNMSFNELEFSRNEEQIRIGTKKGIELESSKKQNHEIGKEAFLDLCSNENYTIIDLREAHETPKLKYESVINISFLEIEKHIKKFNKDQPIVLFCQSGIRSKKALDLFLENGFTNIAHLQKGIQNIQLEVI